MTWPQIVTLIFQLASTLAIVFAAVKYFWSRDQTSGDTLLRMEQTFRQFLVPWQVTPQGDSLPGIARALDPAARKFSACGLQDAILKGFDRELGERTAVEDAWMPRLDDFLRFLLIVAAMERSRLLRRRALWDAYHYWFRAVANDPILRRYVATWFPVLYAFLEESETELKAYDRLDAAGAAAARIAAPVPPS